MLLHFTKEMFIAYARVFMFLISWGKYISAVTSSFVCSSLGVLLVGW